MALTHSTTTEGSNTNTDRLKITELTFILAHVLMKTSRTTPAPLHSFYQVPCTVLTGRCIKLCVSVGG